MDALLHFLAGLLAMLLFCLAYLLVPLPFVLATTGAVLLYVREWTQASIVFFSHTTKKREYDVRIGWDPRDWSVNKNFETWAPIGGLYVIALVAWWLSG